MADPFTEVHNAIWTTLEANTGFTALVPTANRVKLTGTKRGTLRRQETIAHYPEVRVIPANGRCHHHIDSSDTQLSPVWLFQVRYGDERVTEKHFPVMWEIFQAMAAAFPKASTIRSLALEADGCVTDCRLTTFEERYDKREEVPVATWVTLWAYQVDLLFTTLSLPPV